MATRETTPPDEAERKPVFEDILEIVGDLGVAQMVCFCCSFLADITLAFSMLYFLFDAINPGYQCLLENRLGSNTSVWENRNWTYEDQWVENGCPSPGQDCVNLTYASDFHSVTVEWSLFCDRAHLPNLFSTIYFIGVGLGSVLCLLSDRLGRKRTFVGFWFCMGVMHACTTLAQDWVTYTVIRFVVGLFAGALCIVSPILPTGYFAIKWRRIGTLYIGWGVGFPLMALIVHCTGYWRYQNLVTAAISVTFSTVSAVVLPESARLQIQKGQYDQAMQTLKRVAWMNRRTPPSMELVVGVGQAVKQETKQETYTIKDMFNTPVMRKITFVQMFSSLGHSILEFGVIAGFGQLFDSIAINLSTSGILNLVTRLIAIIIMENVGRRKCFCGFLFGPIVAVFVMMVLDFTGTEAHLTRSIMSVACVALMGGVWTTWGILIVETYASVVRGTAFSIFIAMLRIGSILSPQLMLLSTIQPGLFPLLSLILGFTELVLMYTAMPETQGKPLIENLAQNETNTNIVPVLHDTQDSEEEVHFDISNGV